MRRLATTRPELDARQLAELLRRPEWGGFEIAPTRLHAELRRQGLSRTAPQPGAALLAAVGEPLAASAARAAPPATGAARARPDDAMEPVEEVFVEHGGMRILLERAAAGSPCAVLQVEGCVDSGSCDALERLLATAVAARHGVIVDLQEVAYVSSRGWGLLAAAAHGARPDGSVVLACMRPQVREVYRMLGFEPIVSEFASRDAAALALASLPAPPARGAAEPAAAAAAALPVRPAVVDFASGDAGEDWESLRLRIGHAGGGHDIQVIALDGILDTVTAHHFERAIAARAFAPRGAVLVDLSRLEFVSSAGWGCLTAFAADHRARGGAVRLFGMSRSLGRIYELLHLEAVLPSHDVLADALAACGATEVAVPERIAVEVEPARAIVPAVEPAPQTARPFTVTRDAAQLQLDGLRAAIEPYGTSGRAQRLVLEGAWAAGMCDEMAQWLARHACPGELLLVDARALRAGDPCGWNVLCRHTEELATHGVAVRIVAPTSRQAAPPKHLGLRLHPSLVEALRAQQSPAWRRLETAALDAAEFAKDAEVRREGWAAYAELLRQAYREDAP